ncbi:MAG TPA: biliverdin-producing heme oxygenase [Azospirillaceae bacterium]|nr:biliverdin-producing heme oxygenase [Azospirillaceae bacterium]
MTVLETARDALRHATHEVHEALHHATPFARLMEGALGCDDYGVLLLRLHGFHAPLERAIMAADAELRHYDLDPEPRRRAHLLRADLRAVGYSDAEIDAAPSIDLSDLPAAPGSAIGRLYVREGSTLGGRLMAARMAPLLGPGGGASFLASGSEQGVLWRDCCRAVEECGARPERRAAMIAAATDTFERFRAWIAPLG